MLPYMIYSHCTDATHAKLSMRKMVTGMLHSIEEGGCPAPSQQCWTSESEISVKPSKSFFHTAVMCEIYGYKLLVQVMP